MHKDRAKSEGMFPPPPCVCWCAWVWVSKPPGSKPDFGKLNQEVGGIPSLPFLIQQGTCRKLTMEGCVFFKVGPVSVWLSLKTASKGVYIPGWASTIHGPSYCKTKVTRLGYNVRSASQILQGSKSEPWAKWGELEMYIYIYIYVGRGADTFSLS